MKTEAMESNWHGGGYCGLSDPEGIFEGRYARQEASSCAKRSAMASGQGELKWPGAPGVPTPARGPLPYLLTHPHWFHCRLHPRRILINPSWESCPRVSQDLSASQKWPALASWPTSRSSRLPPPATHAALGPSVP